MYYFLYKFYLLFNKEILSLLSFKMWTLIQIQNVLTMLKFSNILKGEEVRQKDADLCLYLYS